MKKKQVKYGTKDVRGKYIELVYGVNQQTYLGSTTVWSLMGFMLECLPKNIAGIHINIEYPISW